MRQVSPIALIGFGEVGQILAEDLLRAAVGRLAVYDTAFADRTSGPSQAIRRSQAGDDISPFSVSVSERLCPAPSTEDAVRDAGLVISAVTAANSLEACRSVCAGLRPGAYVLDLNSVSPGVKRSAAAIIDTAGGRYVEAAVMSPIGPKRIAAPMLLGGPHAAAFAELARPLGFENAQIFSDVIGKASATKMCRSVVVKGIEALLAESMLAARRHGVEQEVLASLSDLLPVGDWPRLARYMISRSLEHGTRRAEEMREAGRTVGEAGVEPHMCFAISERHRWAADHKAALAEPELGAMLDAILQEITAT